MPELKRPRWAVMGDGEAEGKGDGEPVAEVEPRNGT